MTGLTAEQVAYLLRPVQPHRVAQDDGGHSHLPQQDVRAHLTRVFGFGGWDSYLKESALVFEENAIDKRTGEVKADRWNVCYRATVALTVKDREGVPVGHYEDTSTGDAQNQTRLAGHDLALKSAASTALKRAATSLGDQFGLSLYNKGSRDAFVLFTLVRPTVAGAEVESAEEVPAAEADEEVSA